MNDANLKYQIIYDIVSAEDNILNIKEFCEVAGVSRSGYYTWVNAEPKRMERELQDDFNLRQSMSRRGNCWDNAPQERFFYHSFIF